MDELMRENANFADQMEEWQRVRGERGEDPQDWGAFREHLLAIGAPDPGFLRPDAFSAYQDRTDTNRTEGVTGAMQGAEIPPQGEPGTDNPS